MVDRNAKILELTQRFRASLDTLKKTIAGRWVIFRGETDYRDFETETEAYESAIKTFGPDGSFVIMLVADAAPTPVTAAVLYGIH